MRRQIGRLGEHTDADEVGDFGLRNNRYGGQQACRWRGSMSTEVSIKSGHPKHESFQARNLSGSKAVTNCADGAVPLRMVRSFDRLVRSLWCSPVMIAIAV